MSDNGANSAQNLIDTSMFGCALLSATIAAQVGFLLQTGIPASDVMNMLIEHVAKILALVEPEQVRNEVLGQIRRNLPMVVGRHVMTRKTTPGGVFVAGPQDMPGKPN